MDEDPAAMDAARGRAILGRGRMVWCLTGAGSGVLISSA
jgi:hypothetical protein